MDTQTALLLIGFGLFNWFVIRKYWIFLCNLLFMILGGALLMTQDNNTQALLGLLLIISGIVMIIVDFLINKNQ